MSFRAMLDLRAEPCAQCLAGTQRSTVVQAKMESGLFLTTAARSYINSSCSSKIVPGFNGLLTESLVLQATTAPKD